jgi:hypothetical protein
VETKGATTGIGGLVNTWANAFEAHSKMRVNKKHFTAADIIGELQKDPEYLAAMAEAGS